MEIVYILAALLLTLPIATLSFYRRENLAGVLLCLSLAFFAWYMGQLLPIMGGPIWGILTGLVITNLWKKQDAFSKGIKVASKRILQMSIVLLGFQMDLVKVFEMGRTSLMVSILTIAVALTVALVLGKILNSPSNEKVLIGVGTAICGGSAIAATAPVLEASDKEIARALTTIFFFNLLAAFIFPILGRAMNMSDTMFGIWAGVAVNDTSSVVAAGYAYSDMAGDIAVIVKLTRSIMIIPIVLCIALMKSGKTKANVMKSFPWFILAFLLASVINTSGLLPADMTVFWSVMGRFFIVTAMVAIGFGCDIKELISGGKRPLFIGLCCSLSVGAVALLLINMIK